MTLADKIHGALKDLRAKIKALGGSEYIGINGERYGYEELRQAEKLFENALAESTRRAGRTTADTTRQAGRTTADTRFSIRSDAEGNTYVNIDEDILAGVSEKEARTVVKNFLKDNFPLIRTSSGDIIVNAGSRGEFTNSSYSRMLERTDAEAYRDKLRSANNLDEIIQNRENTRGETPKHQRKDSIVGFENGAIRIKVGNNLYSAIVQTGVRNDGTKVFNDILNLKKETGAVTSVSPQRADNTGMNQRSASDTTVPHPAPEVKSNSAQKENIFSSKSAKDTRFSLKHDVEETRDLIAAHNIKSSDLLSSAELGGLPMPSIAVEKTAHNEFGDITLLFNKSAIDPGANADNRVYGGDAYTPTFPRVVNKPNEAGIKALSERLGKSASYLEANHFDNVTAEDAADSLKRADYVREAFAREKGYTVTPAAREADILFTANKYGKAGEFIKTHSLSEILDDPAVEAAYIEAVGYIEPDAKPFLKRRAKWAAEYAEHTLKELKDGALPFETYRNMFDNDSRVARGESVTHYDENSYRDGMYNLIDEHEAEYNDFVDDMVKIAMGGKYIENGKNPFKKNGNRRSFDELHEEYTLGNVVAQMKSELDRGGGALFAGTNAVRGAVAKSYSDIGELKSDSSRLQTLSQDEVDGIRNGFSDRLSSVVDKAVTGAPGGSGAATGPLELAPTEVGTTYRRQNALSDFSDAVIAAANKSDTADSFIRNLRREAAGYNLTPEVIKELFSLLTDMRDAPVRYFEAKPQRAVGFDEVAAAVIPDYASAEIRQTLADMGIPITEYTGGDIKSRTDAVNKAADETDIKFSLKRGSDKQADTLTEDEINEVRSIGRKSVNEFTSDDITKTSKFAQRYFKEMGTKSPFFRTWFGDWRQNDTSAIRVTDISKAGSGKRGIVKNKDTGIEINNSRLGNDHIRRHMHNSALAKHVIANLDSITQNAVLLESYVSERTGATKHKNTIMMHSFYAPVTVNGESHILKLFVEEYYNDWISEVARRNYDLSEIKNITDGTRFGSRSSHPTTTSGDVHGYTVADLFEFVKSNDANFSAKNPSKAVNEDGTPRVVYHGTNEQFNVFELSRTGKNFGEVAEGMFFFTSYKSEYPNSADDYARYSAEHNGGDANIKEVYLNIKNPLQLDSRGYYSTNEYYDRNADFIYDKYFSGDYDGIIIQNSDKNSDDAVLYVVDNPTQIKSATDNIGTFDAQTPDIRYSLKRDPDSDTASNPFIDRDKGIAESERTDDTDELNPYHARNRWLKREGEAYAEYSKAATDAFYEQIGARPVGDTEPNTEPKPADTDAKTEADEADAAAKVNAAMEKTGASRPSEMAEHTPTRREVRKAQRKNAKNSAASSVKDRLYTFIVDDMHAFFKYNAAAEEAKTAENIANGMKKSAAKSENYGKRNPYKLAMNSKQAAARSAYIISDKLIDYDNNVVGAGLSDTLKESGITGKNWDDFNKYLTARHAAEWLDPTAQKAIPTAGARTSRHGSEVLRSTRSARTTQKPPATLCGTVWRIR